MTPREEGSLILGELKEFKRATLVELDIIKKDVRDLSIFKWKAAGIMSFIMLLGEAVHVIARLNH